MAHTKDMKLIPSSHPAVRTIRNRVNSLSVTAIVASAVKAVVIARGRDILQLGQGGPGVRPSCKNQDIVDKQRNVALFDIRGQ